MLREKFEKDVTKRKEKKSGADFDSLRNRFEAGGDGVPKKKSSSAIVRPAREVTRRATTSYSGSPVRRSSTVPNSEAFQVGSKNNEAPERMSSAKKSTGSALKHSSSPPLAMSVGRSSVPKEKSSKPVINKANMLSNSMPEVSAAMIGEASSGASSSSSSATTSPSLQRAPTVVSVTSFEDGNSSSPSVGKLAWPQNAGDGEQGLYTGDTAIDGMPQGIGELVWPDGRRYVGQFRNGRRHGPGQFWWPATAPSSSLAASTAVPSRAAMSGPNNSPKVQRREEPSVSPPLSPPLSPALTPNSFPALLASSIALSNDETAASDLAPPAVPQCHTFEGLWEDDKRHGKGEETAVGGNKLIGTWSAGYLVGTATLQLCDGCSYEIEWTAESSLSFQKLKK